MLDHLDVLTATGRAVMWCGAGAVIASVLTGWASLAVVGMLGLGVVYVTATWTALMAGGDEPWRAARVARAILPEVAAEGDPIREEVKLRGIRIPSGFRLFASGETGRLGVTSRYVVGAGAAGAEVLLESALGPAPRGEHAIEPMAMWLQDVLGLCQTPVARFGATRYSVLPRPGLVDGAKKLLGRGGDSAEVLPAQRLPTEGWFRLREYAPGDDSRRIHWLRSLQAQKLVVRLPDEIPPAEPAVRLILDNHLVGIASLSCKAPGELLDALVKVWLGVGRSLADQGVRVNLVAAVPKGGAHVSVERPMRSRALQEALVLGSRVTWQQSLPLRALLKASNDKARQVVVSSRPRPQESPADVLWLVVPEAVWTAPEPWPDFGSAVTLPFPIGSPENRFGERARARTAILRAHHDGAIFNDLLCWTDWSALRGAFLARPAPAKDGTRSDRVALEVIA